MRLLSRLSFNRAEPNGGPKRVRTPTVLQMEAVECGAASLRIVLGFFGRWVPLEELRVACDVSRDGTKASNIVKAARKYGAQAKGFRKDPTTIRQLKMPVIIHWNFNHFLVLEGFKKDKVYLSDPAHGRYAVTMDEFDKAFTGVALAVEPTEGFQKTAESRSVIASLLPRIRSSRAALSFIFLASLGLVVPGLVIPTFNTVFIDQYLVRRMSDWVLPLILVMGLIMLLNAALTWLQQRYLLRLQTKLAIGMSSGFLRHILRLPVEFFNHRSPGEIGSRVAINDRVANMISGQVATTLLSVVTMVFYLGLMLLYDVVLTLVSVVMAGLNVVALMLVSRKRVDGNRRLLQDHGKLLGVTMNGLRMIETIKASAAEGAYYTKWSGQFVKVINAQQELGAFTRILNTVPPLLQSVATIAVLALGSIRVMDGELTIGMLIAFQFLMGGFLGPVNSLVGIAGMLQEGEGDMNRLDDVLRHNQAPYLSNVSSSSHPVTDRAKLRGSLEVRDLTFGYSKLAPPLFEGYGMTVSPGSWVALVGSSGCGKSTLARLIGGLYEPWNGEILFDGRERTEFPRAIVSNSVSVVDQDILLYNDTIAANLSLWDRSIPRKQILQAAQDACAHEFIKTRPGEYDCVLGEGGKNMSGGQRQRLEIARALASNPSFLILDEATSALDPTTELKVMENIRRRGCSCLVVAHRLSTIRDCDEIIALDRGNVVERGTHDNLIGAGGFYADLLAAT